MFTFTKLGTMGRFGNQLFQIAATIGVAVRHDDQYVFPRWNHAGFFAQPLRQTGRTLRPDLTITQIGFDFRDIRITAEGKTEALIDLVGYYQSERFFLHCADLIQAQFAPSAAMCEGIDRAYGHLLTHSCTCAVVVRRGDYAQYPLYFPMQPPEFYLRAIARFPAETRFIVSSDDVEWCRAHLSARDIVFLPLDDDLDWIRNFFVTTRCHHAIISNTSFGWWIGWLMPNPAKQVIAPARWFGPALDYLDTSDVLPPGWQTEALG
jgi:hypothetical protein